MNDRYGEVEYSEDSELTEGGSGTWCRPKRTGPWHGKKAEVEKGLDGALERATGKGGDWKIPDAGFRWRRKVGTPEKNGVRA